MAIREIRKEGDLEKLEKKETKFFQKNVEK